MIKLTLNKVQEDILIKSKNLPLFSTRVKAGSPSSTDYGIDEEIDLNQLLIKYPENTFLVQVEGNAMAKEGIHSGDILVVDHSVEVEIGKVVIVSENDGWVLKRIKSEKDIDISIWGIVTYVIHKV